MLTLAFFIGLLSSVHCVGMCGPILFALPASTKASRWRNGLHLLLYQAGRILTYGFLGVLLGLLSVGSWINGWQQYISIFTGVFLLAMGLYHVVGRQVKGFGYYQQAFMRPILHSMSYWLQRPHGHFMVGVLNGLLPCGMVYMALAAALNTGSMWRGFFFMLLFGLGTLPLLLTSAILGGMLKARIKFNVANWLPILFVVMGIWFMLRGANLGIPYVSPTLHETSSSPLCK